MCAHILQQCCHGLYRWIAVRTGVAILATVSVCMCLSSSANRVSHQLYQLESELMPGCCAACASCLWT
jgi:hypothetical protein